MVSGGPRVGAPGQSYPNRSDLQAHQAPQAAPGQQYGQAGAQEAAQRQIPLPATPEPGAGGAFDRPTENPQEAVTTGLPVGAGGGPEVLTQTAPPDDFASQARALYVKYGTEGLRRVVELIDEGP